MSITCVGLQDNCTEILRFRSGVDASSFEQEVGIQCTAREDTVFSSLAPPWQVNARLERTKGHSTSSGVAIEVEGSQVSVEPLLMQCHDAVCVSTSRVIHRRGHNRSHFTRVTLNVDYTRSSATEVDKLGFVDDDSEASQACGGIVGPRYIDAQAESNGL